MRILPAEGLNLHQSSTTHTAHPTRLGKHQRRTEAFSAAAERGNSKVNTANVFPETAAEASSFLLFLYTLNKSYSSAPHNSA